MVHHHFPHENWPILTWRQLPVQRYVEELAATHPMLLALVIFVGDAT